jgi:hypothetical protein
MELVLYQDHEGSERDWTIITSTEMCLPKQVMEASYSHPERMENSLKEQEILSFHPSSP